eukprot:CAMPEP_0198281842 /NCGR_PEP_ID=MMETSP1449-20131203/1717_1 /TAXON_ID=420275 /ORGANISM="Attheya septentrionalis, Strain CCMP2084" /LENGTH=577 /DNA_ID=CAMNT_0043977795 /DNA_START=56 /DNA_END=1789 /DNA_ORIENTATION=-
MSHKKRKLSGVIDDLQNLLGPLTSYELLSLTVTSSFAAAATIKSKRPKEKDTNALLCVEESLAQGRQEELHLFETHIAPYEDLLNAAAAHVNMIFGDEIFYFNTSYDRGKGRYTDPTRRDIEGPKPDLHVWMGLFLGPAAEKASRARFAKDEEDEGKICYEDIQKAFCPAGSIRAMPILELARNILQYLETEANKLRHQSELLRFCATYGLSHAARNVLKGKYGEVEKELTINTLLVIPCQPKISIFLSVRPICMPFVGIGAVLGYSHVVSFAVQTMEADLQTPMGIKLENGQVKKLEEYRVGKEVLRWAILSKQPEMVNTLVENGVQFRWLSNEDLEEIWKVLFHVDDGQSDEYGPRWLPSDYDPMMNYGGGMREMRRYRARSCYKEKKTVLSAIIAAGLPRDLFCPPMDDSIETNAMEEAKANGLNEPSEKMWIKITREMSQSEGKRRDLIAMACVAYNQVTKRANKKTFCEFYQHMLAMWNTNKPNMCVSQESHLSEFEDADPRWRDCQKKGETMFRPWWEESHSDYWDDEDDSLESTTSSNEVEDTAGLRLLPMHIDESDGSEESEDGLSEEE